MRTLDVPSESRRIRADDPVVALGELAPVVDLDAGDDVAERVLADRADQPLVPHLLQVREKNGVVDVPVRVEVAPPDLDLLLVHGCRRVGGGDSNSARDGRRRDTRRRRRWRLRPGAGPRAAGRDRRGPERGEGAVGRGGRRGAPVGTETEVRAADLDRLPALRVVATCSVGFDHVDLAGGGAARRLGLQRARLLRRGGGRPLARARPRSAPRRRRARPGGARGRLGLGGRRPAPAAPRHAARRRRARSHRPRAGGERPRRSASRSGEPIRRSRRGDRGGRSVARRRSTSSWRPATRSRSTSR